MHRSKSGLLMSESGQTRPWRHVRVESVLHPTSDIGWCARHGREVPGRDIAPPITAVMPAAEAVLRGLSRKIALRPVHPFAASACSAVHRSKLGIKARDLISQIDWLAPSVVAAAAHVG